MKVVVDFIKTTLLGGVVVLIPILLCYLVLSEMLEILVELATPIVEMLPSRISKYIEDPLIVAIFVLLSSAFLAGLALRSVTLKKFGARLESAALVKVPMYKAVKRLSHGLLGAQSDDVFRCGFIELNPGVRELVYIVEDLDNGFVTVMVPLAPTGFNGPLKIIEADKVVRIEASVGEASKPVSEWGVGLQGLVSGHKSS